MSATNSGVTPEPGFTFSNVFLLYSRDQLKGPDGVLATGQNSVMMNMSSFVGGREADRDIAARFSASATLPVANNSLIRTLRAS